MKVNEKEYLLFIIVVSVGVGVVSTNANIVVDVDCRCRCSMSIWRGVEWNKQAGTIHIIICTYRLLCILSPAKTEYEYYDVIVDLQLFSPATRGHTLRYIHPHYTPLHEP